MPLVFSLLRKRCPFELVFFYKGQSVKVTVETISKFQEDRWVGTWEIKAPENTPGCVDNLKGWFFYSFLLYVYGLSSRNFPCCVVVAARRARYEKKEKVFVSLFPNAANSVLNKPYENIRFQNAYGKRVLYKKFFGKFKPGQEVKESELLHLLPLRIEKPPPPPPPPPPPQHEASVVVAATTTEASVEVEGDATVLEITATPAATEASVEGGETVSETPAAAVIVPTDEFATYVEGGATDEDGGGSNGAPSPPPPAPTAPPAAPRDPLPRPTRNVGVLDRLPDEVLLQVLLCLSRRDLDALKRTCRDLQKLVNDTPQLQPSLLRDGYLLLQGRVPASLLVKLKGLVGYMDNHLTELATWIGGTIMQASLADGVKETNWDLRRILERRCKQTSASEQLRLAARQKLKELDEAMAELEELGRRFLAEAGVEGEYRRMHAKLLRGYNPNGPQPAHLDGPEVQHYVMVIYLTKGPSTAVRWTVAGRQRELMRRTGALSLEELVEYWPLPWPVAGDERRSEFVTYAVDERDVMIFPKCFMHYGPFVDADVRDTFFTSMVPVSENDDDNVQYTEPYVAMQLFEEDSDEEPDERHVDAQARNIRRDTLHLQLEKLTKARLYKTNLLTAVHDLLFSQRDDDRSNRPQLERGQSDYDFFMDVYGKQHSTELGHKRTRR